MLDCFLAVLSELDLIETETKEPFTLVEQNPENCQLISGLPLNSICYERGTEAPEKAQELCGVKIDDPSQAKHNGTSPRGQIKRYH